MGVSAFSKEQPGKAQTPARDFPFCVRESSGGLPGTGNRELPFMANESTSGTRLNSSKIIEVGIGAILTTLLIYLLAIPKIEEKISTLSKEVNEVKSEIREIRSDIYVPAHKANPQQR